MTLKNKPKWNRAANVRKLGSVSSSNAPLELSKIPLAFEKPKPIVRKLGPVSSSNAPLERSEMSIALEQSKKEFDNIASKSLIVEALGPQLQLINSLSAAADHCEALDALIISMDKAIEGLQIQILDTQKMRVRLYTEIRSIINNIDKVKFADPKSNKVLAETADEAARNVQQLVTNKKKAGKRNGSISSKRSCPSK